MNVPANSYSQRDPDGINPDLRDWHERVGRALMQVFALSHRIVLDSGPDGLPLVTTNDLQKIRPDVLDVSDDAAPVLAQVGPQSGNVWAWFRFLIAPESPTCVKPDGLGDDEPGRWLLQTLPLGADCGTNRYLAHVEYLADQVDNKELTVRCRNKTPALFVSLLSDDLDQETQTQAYHRIVARYRVRALSANFHGGVQARFSSPLEIERQSDPGTQRILGDARRVLIHDTTLQDCLGVSKVTLGGYRALSERSAERTIVDEIQFRVIGYVNTPNTPCEAVAPWRMWVQLQDELGADAGVPFEVTS